ncbi:18S rRNA pseudouridine methyltransferase [Savitreella phatthalungensis]
MSDSEIPQPLRRREEQVNGAGGATIDNPSVDVHGAPVQAKAPNEHGGRRLIVVLERACLETYKVGKDKASKYALLNCDDHQGVLKKMGRDIADARPDICHQVLLTLLDSPLNKAGHLQIYIHTARNVLIEVNPHVRLPRTFKRFSGLMVQLLHKLAIRSTSSSSTKLLKVIKNPITDHLPTKCHKITLSHDAPTVKVADYVSKLPEDTSLCVFIGAMAHGADDFADFYVDEKISVSDYSLSASVSASKFLHGCEDAWKVQ